MQYLFSKLLLTKLVASKELFREKETLVWKPQAVSLTLMMIMFVVYYCSDVIYSVE